MRHTLATVALPVMVIGILSTGSIPVGPLRGQPPAGPAELSPTILAFLKPVEPAAGDSELQQKLKERHNVAVKLLEARVNEYKRGVRDIAPVFEAARLAAEAKLDLDPSDKARVAVLEQTLEVARVIESSLQQQLDKGFGSKGDLERARFGRLTVEVELIKARQKLGSPK
jgi:hypothetical protein